MDDQAATEKLAAALSAIYVVIDDDDNERAAAALLPVVRELAAEKLREAADELDDIADAMDPKRRSIGLCRGYRVAAYLNRSRADALTGRTT